MNLSLGCFLEKLRHFDVTIKLYIFRLEIDNLFDRLNSINLPDFNGDFTAFCSSIGFNAIFSNDEQFRLVVKDSENVYVFSISHSSNTIIVKFNLNMEKHASISNDIQKYVKKMIASNYPEINANDVLENNKFYEARHLADRVSKNPDSEKMFIVEEKESLPIPEDNAVENELNLRGQLLVSRKQHTSMLEL